MARTERPQRHHLEDVDVVVDEKKKKKKKMMMMMMMTLNTRMMIAAAADARPTSPPPPPPRFSSLFNFCFGDKASFFGDCFFFLGRPAKQEEERFEVTSRDIK